MCYLDRRKIAERQDEYGNWMSRDKPNCNCNYIGSSQGMEAEAAKRIWGRSLEKHLSYSTFIGDGDSKSFLTLSELDPYHPLKIHKEECLSYVTKRLKKPQTYTKKYQNIHLRTTPVSCMESRLYLG